MGKLKQKAIEVQEFFLNGYDVEDIPYLTDLSLDDVITILKQFGVSDEDMEHHQTIH